MATRKEVAELAGVSEATVSRVLNGVGPIREETRRRVLEAAEQLGYQPSALAQSFARGRSGNLGVVLPYLPKVHLFSTFYFSEILSGIGEAVRDADYGLLLLFRSPVEEPDYTAYFRTQKVDACIILGARDLPDERRALGRLQQEGFPFCLVNQHFHGETWNEVDADHVTGSYTAAAHLIAQGYRRIGFLNGSPQYSNSRDRLAGYRKAMEEAGLVADPRLLFEGNYSRTSGISAASAVQACMPGLDAVLAANDRMAIGLMQGLRSRGITPGKDLAILGYDDSDAARVTDPPLSSVHVPFYEMGKLAAGRLLERMQGGSAEPFQERLPTRLVLRQSCTNQE